METGESVFDLDAFIADSVERVDQKDDARATPTKTGVENEVEKLDFELDLKLDSGFGFADADGKEAKKDVDDFDFDFDFDSVQIQGGDAEKKDKEDEVDLDALLKELEEEDRAAKARKAAADEVDLDALLKDLEDLDPKQKEAAEMEEAVTEKGKKDGDVASEVSSSTRRERNSKTFLLKWEVARTVEFEQDYWMVAAMWGVYGRYKPFKKCMKKYKV